MSDALHTTLSIPPSAAALLLVDLQEEHRRDERFIAADYAETLANAARLLAAARGRGVAVYHGQFVREFAKVPPRPFEILGEGGGPGFSDSSAAGLIAFCPEVAPLAAETVIVKNDNSCFSEESLLKSLKDKGIEWLVIAGAWTEACVAATVRDATAKGFRVLLVKDACSSGTRFMHRVAVLNLANRLVGGAVADTERVVRLLSGGEARVWRLDRMLVPLRFEAATVDSLYESL